MSVRVRRVYEAPRKERGDGFHVLVDRLWPRGMSKERLQLDRWAKELAPSPELRTWYGHRPERFAEFAKRYRMELRGPERRSGVAELRRIGARGALTLLTATKDAGRSGAAVLAEVVQQSS
jgi:uncharacterized protein YeaO (DUF488 family)